MDGTPVTYTAWEKNEPNFANNDENCVTIYKSMGKLGVIECIIATLLSVVPLYGSLTNSQAFGMTSTVAWNCPPFAKEAATLSTPQWLPLSYPLEVVHPSGCLFRGRYVDGVTL